MYGLGQGITLYKKNKNKWFKGINDILEKIYQPLGRFEKLPGKYKRGVIDIVGDVKSWSQLNRADTHGGVFAQILNIYKDNGITFGEGLEIDVDALFERLSSPDTPNMSDFFSEGGQYYNDIMYDDRLGISYTKDKGDANEQTALKYLKTLWKNDNFEIMDEGGDARDIDLGKDIIKTNKSGVEVAFQVKPFAKAEITEDGMYKVIDVGSARQYTEENVRAYVFVRGNDIILIENKDVVADEMEKSYTFGKDVVIRDPQDVLKRLTDESDLIESFIKTGKI
jgi:hypothetical protein